jgi:hypothetical protein
LLHTGATVAAGVMGADRLDYRSAAEFFLWK